MHATNNYIIQKRISMALANWLLSFESKLLFHSPAVRISGTHADYFISVAQYSQSEYHGVVLNHFISKICTQFVSA